jgi:polyisoprenoid-binding protein YceI
VDYLGFTRVTGWLDQVSGVVVTDLVAGAGQIDLIVDAKSVNTGSELRDALVRSAMLFDVAHHPLIRFHSTAVTFEHHDVVGVAGMLTLHGVTQPVVWHVGPSRCSELHSLGPADCSLSATLTVHRSDFGMRYALPFVGDDVDLEFNLHWSRPAPTNGPAEGEGDR